MTLHDDATALLRAWTPPDDAQAALRHRYLTHLAECPDGLSRSCIPDHLTASAVVLSPDGASVLLTLHARAGRWFQFGGHCEAEDTTLAGAARREAVEESGLALEVDPVPVQLSEHAVPFCGTTGSVHHLDVRFLAVVPADAVPRVSQESTDVAWWPADALPDPDPDMVELISLARARLAESAQTFAPPTHRQ